MTEATKEYLMALASAGATHAEVGLIQVLIDIKHSLDKQTAAIELLARATAGEFDQQASDDEGLPRSLGER